MPVWRELLADLETPVAAFAKLRRRRPGFLLESVEHGERWSRFSFVGPRPGRPRSCCATASIDGRRRAARRRCRSTGACWPRSRRCSRAYRAPELAELPPLHGGLMGYLGYDVVREVERLPDVPPDDRGLPDAVMSVIGALAAFDHWRQRVTLIESVPRARPDRRRARRRLRRGRRPASSGRAPTARPARSPYVAGRAARARRRAARRALARWPDGMYQRGGRGGQGAHPRRRHLPGRARPALRPRPRRRPVRRLPGAAPGQPEPVHVLRAPPGADASSARRPSRWCSCSTAR